MAINDYCTVSDVKALTPDWPWTDGYNSQITGLITQVSRAMDRLCNVPPGAFYVDTDATLYFTGSGKGPLFVEMLAAAPTSVSVAESGDVDDSSGSGGTYTAWTASDYLLVPANALYSNEPYTHLIINTGVDSTKTTWTSYVKGVKIAGKFGRFTEVPDDIKLAVLIEVTRTMRRAQQQFGDTGAIIELSQIRYTKAIDPQAERLMESFMRLPI